MILMKYLTLFLPKTRKDAANILPYFYRKLGKILQNLSFAAVVIGALRVKIANENFSRRPHVLSSLFLF